MHKRAYAHSLLALMATSLVGCGSGPLPVVTSNVTTTGPAGKVIQGPVNGSTVWADNLSAGTRMVIDTAEQSTQTTTSASGTYTLPVTPSYKYVIVSQGGTDTITGKTADTLVAPAGAQSVSPLTTLVALDTSGALASKLNQLLPSGVSFDSDLTATGALSPAAMVLLESITTAITSFDSAMKSAASKSNATLSPQQINDINLTLYSQLATQLSGLTTTSLSTTSSLASNLQTALSTAVTQVQSNNSNITGLNASTIASTIANSSVATAANIVGNATGNTDLKNVTATSVQSSGVAVTNSGTLTETTVVSGSNKDLINSTIDSLVSSTATGVTATATPTSYSPPTITVANNPAAIGFNLKVNASGSQWTVTSFTVTFSEDMVSTQTGGTNYAHSVLNPANYQYSTTGCTPASYTASVVTFNCNNLTLQPGVFSITLLKSSDTAGVWASATSLGLLVNNVKSFTLPTVTGSTGGSSLSIF